MKHPVLWISKSAPRHPVLVGVLLAFLTGCMTPLYRQQGMSLPQNLSEGPVESSSIAAKDLSRESDHRPIRTIAMLYTAPYLQAAWAERAQKENIGSEQLRAAIQQAEKNLVNDHTVFTIDIAGSSPDAINFGYWEATVVEVGGNEYPTQIVANLDATHMEEKTITATSYGNGFVSANEATTGNLYERTGFVIGPHVDITKGVQLKLLARFDKDLPIFLMSWDAAGGIAKTTYEEPLPKEGVVPASMFNGKQLNAGGFSVESPASGWKWTQTEQIDPTVYTHNYMGRSPDGSSTFSISITTPVANPSVDDFLSGNRDWMKRQNMEFTDYRSESSSIPFAGSKMAEFRVKEALIHSYVGISDAVYVLQCYMPDSTKAMDQCTAFVHSFELHQNSSSPLIL